MERKVKMNVSRLNGTLFFVSSVILFRVTNKLRKLLTTDCEKSVNFNLSTNVVEDDRSISDGLIKEGPFRKIPSSDLLLSEKGTRLKECIKCKKPVQVTKCECFKALKKSVSNTDYISRRLEENDENGYCSASIFLYTIKNRVIEFVMINETREGKSYYNMPGGKREVLLIDGTKKIENSKETAILEFQEEINDKYLNECLASSKIQSVLWSSKTKSAIYLCQTTSTLKSSTNTKIFNSNNPNLDIIHTFTKNDITTILSHITKTFDQSNFIPVI